MGNSENSQGKYRPLPPEVNGLSEAQRNKILKEKALNYLWKNPYRLPELVAKRMYISLRSETIAVEWNQIGFKKSIGTWVITPLKLVASGFYYLLIAGVFFRLYLSRKGSLSLTASDKALLCMMGLLSVPFIVIVGQDRYHLPMLPFAILLVAPLLKLNPKFQEKV